MRAQGTRAARPSSAPVAVREALWLGQGWRWRVSELVSARSKDGNAGLGLPCPLRLVVGGRGLCV